MHSTRPSAGLALCWEMALSSGYKFAEQRNLYKLISKLYGITINKQ